MPSQTYRCVSPRWFDIQPNWQWRNYCIFHSLKVCWVGQWQSYQGLTLLPEADSSSQGNFRATVAPTVTSRVDWRWKMPGKREQFMAEGKWPKGHMKEIGAAISTSSFDTEAPYFLESKFIHNAFFHNDIQDNCIHWERASHLEKTCSGTDTHPPTGECLTGPAY